MSSAEPRQSLRLINIRMDTDRTTGKYSVLRLAICDNERYPSKHTKVDRLAVHTVRERIREPAVMRDLTILDQATYGQTPEFVAWEMILTVTMDHDEPALGIKAGQTSTIRGVALQWWRWEGEGDEWTGDLSSSKKGILGWKIVKETDYMIPLTGDTVQTMLRA